MCELLDYEGDDCHVIYKNIRKVGEGEIEKIHQTIRTRIQDTAQHADFLIRHEDCDLVLEVKSSLGGLEDHTMTPPSIQKLWSRLYGACTQCATSIQQHRRQDHPILGIVIVTDHMTSQAMPFLSLAERTGLFNDLHVTGIEVFAWSYIEFVLSKTSIHKFIKALKKKWIEGTRQSAGDWLTFEMHADDIPAHRHEYLETSHHALFPGRAGGQFPP